MTPEHVARALLVEEAEARRGPVRQQCLAGALALSAHAHHSVARGWFDSVRDPRAIVFCRATQQTFLRLLTNAAVLRPYGNPPLTNPARLRSRYIDGDELWWRRRERDSCPQREARSA